MEDLPQDLKTQDVIENATINVGFLENKAGEITAGAYFISIAEIVNGAQWIGIGALLIVKNYILGLICWSGFIYSFDFHSKDENGNLWSSGTAVLLKLDNLYSLENYIKPVYYNISVWICNFKSNLQKFTVLPMPRMPLNVH